MFSDVVVNFLLDADRKWWLVVAVFRMRAEKIFRLPQLVSVADFPPRGKDGAKNHRKIDHGVLTVHPF